MIEQFYEECLRFWTREDVENPKEMALNDVRNLKHDPFSPSGAPVNAQDVSKFINDKLHA